MIFWGCVALLLIAAETFAPGAFMLWLGFAAAGTFLLVWLLPLSPLWQAVVFVVLSFISVFIYKGFFRERQRASDQPTLNRRSEQFLGHVLVLESAIINGTGRVRIGDAFWVVSGPDLPIGSKVRVMAVDSMTLKVNPAE